MTVKEVFELRKQGRIEEAYEAIRPMYAVHQGKYTTLCMFWTASDILKKRVAEKRLDEAGKIFKALLRILPNIADADGRAHSSIYHAAVALARESKAFSMLDFVAGIDVHQLSIDDWKPTLTPATATVPSHPIPSVAQQMLTCAFHELQDGLKAGRDVDSAQVDRALKVMPLLQEAMRRNPRDKHNLRHMAVVYRIMGERDKAVGIYRQLLARYRDSYLYAELAELTDDAGQKAALYCHAIRNQRQEKFRSGYRLELARLLLDRDQSKAAHELQRCIATRQAAGFGATREIQQMLGRLQGVSPSTDAEQQAFYQGMIKKFGQLIAEN
ncbi:MAG: acetyltransferase [Prevotella sp.]|nr:acetyltransferase [Prevotella sp.]